MTNNNNTPPRTPAMIERDARIAAAAAIPATAARPAFFAALASLLAKHDHHPMTIECTCGYRRDA